jgi:copper oxidase (laccase) domain-containing protein
MHAREAARVCRCEKNAPPQFPDITLFPVTDVLPLLESFPSLAAHDSIAAHGFVRRVPGVDAALSKSEVVERLSPWHLGAVKALGFSPDKYFTAHQVHGADIAAVTADSPRHLNGVDGLMTTVPGLMLGIHVADCGPVYLLDPVRRAIALLHSGKNGTALNISGRAIRLMQEHYGSRPEDLIVQLGPCIRVPQYDVDFASQILADCRAAGVPAGQVHDCGTCTALHPDLYYSYRRELGKTGRLLALLGLRGSD